MAITLRGNKSQALTFTELDGNFTDLNTRATTIEGAYVKTVNGVSPSSNAVTITTANITENTNLYYTDARARASISAAGGNLAYNSSTGVLTLSDTEIRDVISVTDAGGDGSLAYNASTGVITYTGPSLAEAKTRLNSSSINELSDVDIVGSNAPSANQVLTWNAVDGEFQPATPPGAAGGEANTGTQLGSGKHVFKAKVGTAFTFRSIVGGTGITAVENTNDITLNLDATPTLTGLKVANGGNIGSVGDANAIAIAADGVVTMDQIPVFSAGINVSGGTIAGTLATAAQTNITSIGTLSSLVVSGQADFDDLRITGNKIESDVSNADLTLDANGTGSINVSSNKITNVGTPAQGSDAVNKTYADLKLALAGGTMGGVIAMGTNKITGMGDPGAAQDAATKAYVDTSISSLNSDKIIEGNSQVEVIDSGTGSVVITVDGVAEQTIVAASTTFGGNLIIPNAGNIGSVSDTNAIAIAAGGDVTVSQGLIVTGNLTVNGTTTTLNTAEMKIEDINLTIADGAADSAAANGAGITIDGAGATITYSHSGTKFVFNKPIDAGANAISTTGAISGTGASITGLSGSNISTGTVAAARVATLNQDTTGTAAIATTFTVADEGTDATCFPVFATAATGNVGGKTDSVLTYNSSNGTLGATTFSGVATTAKYADLAEKYTTDETYIPGTVMTVGGGAETTSADSNSQYIAGVISTDPAYLMNSGADGQAIALVGRVPVRIINTVTKGQAVFASENGTASAIGTGPIVGIALETNSNSDEKSVECMLKV